MTVPNVGPIVAIIYETAVDDPHRIKKSKGAGPVFGLTPKRYQSGETDVIGGISRIRDAMVRAVLMRQRMSYCRERCASQRSSDGVWLSPRGAARSAPKSR
jgi:transposase